MNDYDAYLFDWDGTVAETLDIWLNIWQGVLAEHGKTADEHTIVKHLYGDVRAGLKHLEFTQGEITQLLDNLHPMAKARVQDVTLYKDVKNVLLALKSKHKKLALITSSYRDLVDAAIANHELVTLFDVLITAESVPAHKPDPAGIYAALETLDVPKDRALMIGDSDKDLGAAQNAGIDSLLFYPDKHALFHKKEVLETYNPKYVVNTWQEFLDKVQ